MADEQEPRVTAAYRALGAEEPPRALDKAILAAARRPAQAWSARWAVPLSLAAVLVLSVVVTLRIQHEQPELATAPAPPAAQPPAPQGAPPQTLAPKVEDQPKAAARPARKSDAGRAEPKPFAEVRSERVPASAADAQAPAPAAKAAELSAANLAAESPERELERIARLRAEGRHDEADKALAEFRKRYPEYRIAEEMLRRVERR